MRMNEYNPHEKEFYLRHMKDDIRRLRSSFEGIMVAMECLIRLIEEKEK